ncbi:hypothetical protein BH10ACT8_BH10ACT8_15900 [soil metagenome]|jgi:hypothetical protein
MIDVRSGSALRAPGQPRPARTWRCAAVRALAVTVLATAFTLIGSVIPASAHTVNGTPVPDAANYLSVITGFSPATPGLTARIDPRGEWIEVSNSTRQTLIILGYAGEPYLRVTPAGVDANINAPSWALNHALFGDLSQLGDTQLPQEWQRQQQDPNASWHDHRIHWMGVQRPPIVAANPATDHVIGTWRVRMTLAGRPITLTGTLNWTALQPVRQGSSTHRLELFLGLGGPLGVAAGAVWILRRRRRGGPPASSVRDRLPQVAADPPVTAANLRSRKLLDTTNTELSAIAAPAMSGLSRPEAANGNAATL